MDLSESNLKIWLVFRQDAITSIPPLIFIISILVILQKIFLDLSEPNLKIWLVFCQDAIPRKIIVIAIISYVSKIVNSGIS